MIEDTILIEVKHLKKWGMFLHLPFLEEVRYPGCVRLGDLFIHSDPGEEFFYLIRCERFCIFWKYLVVKNNVE
jgi:hypothetical protein